MKKKLKSALSLLLCMIMVFGTVSVGGFISTANNSSINLGGELITFGSYPQTRVSKPQLIAALGEQPQDENGYVY